MVTCPRRGYTSRRCPGCSPWASAVHLGSWQTVMVSSQWMARAIPSPPLGPDGTHGLGQSLAEGLSSRWRAKVPRLQPGHFDEGGQQELQLVHLPGHEGEELLPCFSGERGAAGGCPGTSAGWPRGLYLVGDVADQALDRLLVLRALALAVGHLLIVLEKLSLDLGGDGVLIGLYGGKAFPP